MLPNYYTIKEDGSFEITIKKSTFICTLKRIDSEEHAKNSIQSIRKEHWKATHNCTAFVLGDNQDIQRSSDDGEPSGTAGIPMLEVLKVKKLKNVLAVVTRYYGGIQLGAGGLIRAYSGAVAETIAHIGLVEGKAQQAIHATIDYSSHGKLEHFLQLNPHFHLKDTVFTDKVEAIIMVDEPCVPSFKLDLLNLLNGQVTLNKGDISYVEVPISQTT